MIGETVGEYKIVGALVPGSTGDVFIGTHKDLGTRAAVEVLNETVTSNAEATAKYLDTVRAVSNIKHGGTMKLVDSGVAEGKTYVIMELLEGDTLAARIAASGRLSTTQIGEIGRQLALVLAAVHDDGIVHGDMRPDVVFLMAKGGLSKGEPVKVTEWGVAALKRAVGLEVAPKYTAPELLGTGEAVDWRVDAYGLGCVVYEMATGEAPFSGTADDLREKHKAAMPPSARALMPDVAPALDQLIGRLMSKKPDDRYGSMREIARLFEPFAGAERPLAPTADIPPVSPAEIGAAAGELRSKEPTKEPMMQMESSIQIEGPEAAQAVVTQAEPLPPPPPRKPPPPLESTLRTPKLRGRSPLPVIVFFVLLVGGAIAAMAFAMR